MKIFISYGHNDHVKLVDKLFDALIQAGHEPWKDDRYEGASGINPGDDFTGAIYSAIDASDFVIAFVSQRTLESDYCKGERNYAYNRKGNHFIQIRLDYSEITLGNERSYVEMSDVEETTGEINEKMFQEAVGKLLAAFRDPVSFAEGGFTPWAKFEKHLKVPGALQYDEFVAMPDADDFVGRKWLAEKCKNWATDPTIPCRLFVIYGEAGTGKTAFVRHLARDKEFVRAVHVCIYDRPRTRTVEDTIKDLAYVLAKNNDTYFNFLKNKDFSTLDEIGVDGLFEFLFLEPLKTESEKFLLVIDGLDELDEKKGFDPLIKLFRQHANRINPNISFLVTGRPDNNIVSRLQTVGSGKAVESINLDIETNNGDLKEYIEKKLRKKDAYTEVLAEKILDACDGNFEYLALLFREIDEGLVLSEQMSLPEGLNSRYQQYIERRFENAGVDLKFSKLQRRIMSVLCASYEPVPLTLLADILGEDEYDIEDEICLFGSLIRQNRSSVGEIMVSFFTKGFRDYLLSRVCREFQADYQRGNKEIAEYVIENFKSEKDFLSVQYMNNNALAHIFVFASESYDTAVDYMKSLYEDNKDATTLRLGEALKKCESEAIGNFATMCETHSEIYYDVSAQLVRNRERLVLNQVVSELEKIGSERETLKIRYDLLMYDSSSGIYAQAEEICHKLLELDELNFKDSPCYETRRHLSGTYDCLGRVAKKQNTADSLSVAENWFYKKLELDECNLKENPCYESRRSFAIACDRLGSMAKSKGTTEGYAAAEKWFLNNLRLCEQNYEEKPCYQSRRDLSVTYNNLGDISKAKNTPEGLSEAEKWYHKELELCEQNYKENPCYQSRRDYTFPNDRLGNVAVAKNTPEGLSEAEKWYSEEIELCKQNYRENPCYESRRALSIAYNKLGGVSMAKNTPEGLSEAEKWYRKGVELCEQNYSDNPCYESREDLFLTYERMGNVARGKNTPESLSEAKEWYYKDFELCEQNYREKPCYKSRRALSKAYNKLGGVSMAKKTPEGLSEAEKWYRKGLELCEQNYSDNPCYESREDLFVTYERMGNVARVKNTPESLSEAKEWYYMGVELCEQNYSDNPCYKSRRALSIAYNDLGDILKAKNTLEGLSEAEKWYHKEIELCEQNYSDNPCYESREALSVTYERMGNVARVKNTPESLSEAKEWYYKVFELSEQNYSDNPCYKSRRALFISCNKLGDIARDKNTPEGLSEAEKWYRKGVELCEQNYRENPCSQSENDLSIAYSRLSNVVRTKNTPEASEEAEMWDEKRRNLGGNANSGNQKTHSNSSGPLKDAETRKRLMELLGNRTSKKSETEGQ